MASVDVTRIASNIGALNSLNSLQNINSKLADRPDPPLDRQADQQRRR